MNLKLNFLIAQSLQEVEIYTKNTIILQFLLLIIRINQLLILIKSKLIKLGHSKHFFLILKIH